LERAKINTSLQYSYGQTMLSHGNPN
jgi:hypothetical protein